MRNSIALLCLIALSFGLRAEHPATLIHPNDASKVTSVAPKTPDSKRWKTGFVVTLKGDTIQGKIKALDFLDAGYDYQKMVAFKDAKDIQMYTPNDLSSFSFYDGQNTPITMQAVSRPDGNGRAFLRLYSNGQCKVYGISIKEINDAAVDVQEQHSLVAKEKKYIQVKNSQFYPIRRAGFRKNMKAVFASSPRIVKGLDSKEYTYAKWEALVRDYNQESQMMQQSKLNQVVDK